MRAVMSMSWKSFYTRSLMTAIGLAVFACGYDGPSIDVDTLKKKLEADANAFFVMDVRPRALFNHGHIAGARNIPVEDIDTHAAELSASTRPVAVICTRGSLSLQAAKKLRVRGLSPYLVLGGMEEWNKAGYPVER